jgi:hypothetical protein
MLPGSARFVTARTYWSDRQTLSPFTGLSDDFHSRARDPVVSPVRKSTDDSRGLIDLMDSKKAGVTALTVLALGAGVIASVALGATSAKHHPGKKVHAVRAATTSTSTTGTTTTGSFKSNEDATHEAGENAAREAAEDSGQAGPGGSHGNGTFTPNEDATHEAGESAAREAQEGTGQAPASP